MSNEAIQDPNEGSGACGCSTFERDAKRFAAAISEWSDAVQREIATRKNAQSDEPRIDEYNQSVVFGLELASSMMIDAMQRQLTR